MVDFITSHAGFDNVVLGIFFKRTKQTDAIIGFAAGILGMVFVIYFTKIAWTWYTLIGVIFTLAAANISNLFSAKEPAKGTD